MAFEPFNGELDKPTEFVPFTGKLDAAPEGFTPFTGKLDEVSARDENYSNEGRGKGTVGASQIPGAENSGARVKMEAKLPPMTALERIGQQFSNQIEGVKAATDVARVAAGMGIGMPLGLIGGAVQSAGVGGDYKTNADAIAAQIGGAISGEPLTETGEDVNKWLEENVYRHAAALGFSPHAVLGKGYSKGGMKLFAKEEAKPMSRVDQVLGASKPKEAPTGVPVQAELFPETPAQGVLADQGPQLPQQAPVVPPRGELANRRQMGFNFGENVPNELQVTREGVALPTNDTNALFARNQQMDAMQRQLDAEQQARAPGQLFPEDPYQGTLADQGPQVTQQAIPQEPVVNGRQMELQPGDNGPLTVTPQGDVLRGAEDPHVLLGMEQAAQRMRAEGTNPVLLRQLEETILRLKQEQAHRAATGADLAAGEHPNVTNDLQGQGDLFGHGTGQPTPFTGEGQWHIDENGMPIRSDLSMEATNVANPLQRNLFGDELGPSLGQDRSLTAALDTMPAGLERMAATERLGVPHSESDILGATARALPEGEYPKVGKNRDITIEPTENGFRAVDKNGKEVGSLSSSLTPEQNRGLGHDPNYPATTGLIKVDKEMREQGIGAALQKAWRDAHEGNAMPHGNTEPAAWRIWKRDAPEAVERFASQEAARIADGGSGEQILGNIRDEDVRAAVIKHLEAGEALKQVVTEEVPTVSNWTPGTRRLGKGSRGQGGFIAPGRGDWEGPKNFFRKFGGVLDNLHNFFPETMTNAEFIAAHPNIKDLDQNVFQRGANNFTKGSLYMAQKTDNPLIKRVTERIRDAGQTTQAMIRDLVHGTKDSEGFAPNLRKLNKEEYVEVSQLVQQAERNNTPINLEAMKTAGFSGDAIKAVAQHADLMKQMYDGPLSAAMEAAGIQGVTPRVAYAAASASGDFRRLVTSAEDPSKIIGILTADSRRGLNRIVEKYKATENAGTVGEERFFGGGKGKGGTSEGFQQMLELISKNDPEISKFVDAANQALQGDARDFLNVKKHTLDKKGIFGMQGNEFHKNAYDNAHNFWQSQIRYMENVIKWGEMSKAIADTKEVLNNYNDVPYTKEYLQKYIDNALGKNPYETGAFADKMFASLGNSMGVGTSGASKLTSAIRQTVNFKLLTSPMFYGQNLIQAIKGMPEMAQFLNANGVKGISTGFGSMAKAAVDMGKEMAGMNLDGITQGALDYAQRKHVYSSDLFETSNRSRNDLGFKFSKYSQMVPAAIEQATRKQAFLSFVNMLHDSGISPKQGLYEAAHNFTDVMMNNYNKTESPLAYQSAGPITSHAANLMSFKHNELSRLAMFAKELPKNGSGRALGTNLLMQVAAGGVMGTIAYQEADWLTRQISSALGKPTSLTTILLQHQDDSSFNKWATWGVGNAAGVDLTSRMGVGEIAPWGALDPTAPENLANAALPGVSALGGAVKDVYQAAVDPSEYNLKKAAVGILPTGAQGLAERSLFAGKNEQGQELAMSLGSATARAVRNETDKTWKNLGATGINEASQKKMAFEQQKTDKFYTDKQADAVNDMRGAMFMAEQKVPFQKNDPRYEAAMREAMKNSPDFQKKVGQFIKFQGDPEKFDKILLENAEKLALTTTQLKILKDAGSDSITAKQRLLRTLGQ